MKKIIFIKLGGSVITDKNVPYKAQVDKIKDLARQLKGWKGNIILAHGSGSFGHTSATKYGGKKGYKSKIGIATVANDATEINKIVMNCLIQEGLFAVSLSPMSMIISSGGKTEKNFFEVIEEVVRQDLIPVIYGDVIWDRKWKSTIYSGEKTINQIAAFLKRRGYKIEKIIQVGKTDGVYDENGKTIECIDKNNWKDVKRFIGKSEGKDVTGGMLHKVEDAMFMAKKGIRTFIISGLRSEELLKAILDKKIKGTLIK